MSARAVNVAVIGQVIDGIPEYSGKTGRMQIGGRGLLRDHRRRRVDQAMGRKATAACELMDRIRGLVPEASAVRARGADVIGDRVGGRGETVDEDVAVVRRRSIAGRSSNRVGEGV